MLDYGGGLHRRIYFIAVTVLTFEGRDGQLDIFSKENLTKKILPFLFSAAEMAAISYIYLETVFNPYNLLSIIITAALFLIYDFMCSHKKLGIPIYIALMAAVVVSINIIMRNVENRFAFLEWFLTGGATIETTPQFMLPLMIFFSFFISSVTYYFTHIIYRVSILTLISLIPCAIYIKASQSVPTFFAIFLAAMNIFMYINHYQRRNSEKRTTAGKTAMLTAYTDFAVAAVLIAVILPKPQDTPFYDRFEAFTNHFSFRGSYGDVSGDFTEHSGNADNFNEMESRVIYYLSTNNPQYFKIQVFNEYDEENRYWIYDGIYSGSGITNRGSSDWEEGRANLNLSALLDIYKQSDLSAAKELIAGIDAESIDSLESDSEYYARITAVDFPAEYLIAPERIFGAELISRVDKSTKMTPAGEVFPAENRLGSAETYDVSFYDGDFARTSGWVESGLCNMSYDEFGELLAALISREDTDSDERDILTEFYMEMLYADETCMANGYPVSAEIQRLSDEITAGLTYDWEKADAIEQYFYTNGFIYDLAYNAPDESDTPEFFIFESKRGTCSDFATAYCLLANAAGLRVRFTEGFICGEAVSEDMYQILTENAHAFPEVYIPGAGWTIYEPTVSGSSGIGTGSDSDDEQTDYVTVFAASVAVFICIILVLLVIIFMPQIEELAFSVRVKLSSAEKGVLLIYRRLSSKAGKIYGTDTKRLTSCQLAKLIESRTQLPTDEIILPFERVCYGNLSADKKESAAALTLYRRLVRIMKKTSKKRRKRK